MHEIILSLALSGRNDDYGHDFKRRFTQAANMLAWCAQQLGCLHEIEIVFADWNSQTPLAEEITLNDEARQICRFITVPPEIAQKYNERISPFQQSYAFNVALRRCRGKFIGIMPADILFTRQTLFNLFALLKKQMPSQFSLECDILAIPRKKLPYWVQEQYFFDCCSNIEKILLSGHAYMLYDNVSRGLMGGYGAFIFAKDLLYRLRGVDQRIAGWGHNDIDIALRAADKAKVINCSGYGVICYDFDPNAGMIAQKEGKRAKVHPILLGHAENTPDWGLAELQLPESKAANKVASDAYSESPVKPKNISYREWIIWLSQHISVWQAPRFSALALVAGLINYKCKPRRILLYGLHDRSIVTLLSLTGMLAELTIAARFSDDASFYKNWYHDAFMGSLHYQGAVHYLPDPEFVDEKAYELIIVDDLIPPATCIANQAAENCSLILSKAARKLKPELPKSFLSSGSHWLETRGVQVLACSTLTQSELQQAAQPMTGNCLARSLLLGKKHFSKLLKLRNIFMRQAFWHWPKTARLIRKIRK